jgi:hypothetical protein
MFEFAMASPAEKSLWKLESGLKASLLIYSYEVDDTATAMHVRSRLE